MMRDERARITVSEICLIVNEVDEDLGDYMFGRVDWYKTAYNRTDMNADEIASASADGFKVEYESGEVS